MKLKQFILVIFSILSFTAWSENYTITIVGKMVDGKGNGIGNRIILITSPSDQKRYFIESKITTYDSGEIKWILNIPDSVKEGILIFTYENCNGKRNSFEYMFSKEKNIIEVKFLFCEGSVKDCGISIKTKIIHDSLGIAVVAHKGKGPFRTKWSNGTLGDTLEYNPLLTARYCATSTDSSGCTSEECFGNIKPCVSIVIARRISDTQAVAYVVAKGRGKFTHTWTTGQKGDTIRFNPLNKIKICVRSTDTTGCETEACVVNILEPCRAGIERSKNSLYAYLKNDLAKSFLWSNGSEKESIEIKDTGTYCVVITSITGCKSEACFRVRELNTSTCAAEIVLDSLGSDNSTPGVKLRIKADFDLKFIEWNTGEKTPTIIAHKSGEYCVSISDNFQCKAFICKKVNLGPVDPVCNLSIQQDYVPGTASSQKDSSKVKLSFRFSNTPKIIFWSTGETAQSIIVSKSGEYCVTVSDGINCKQIVCTKVVIKDNPLPPNTDCKVGIVVKPISNKELSLSAKLSGKSPIAFEWSNGSKDAVILVKQSGNYCITVKDGAGCSTKACVDVEIDPGAGSGINSPENKKNQSQNISAQKIVLDVFPNPSPTKIYYNYSTIKNTDAYITLVNMYGKKVYQEKISLKEGKAQGELDVSFFPTGIYQMVVEQQGTQVTSKVVIGR